MPQPEQAHIFLPDLPSTFKTDAQRSVQAAMDDVIQRRQPTQEGHQRAAHFIREGKRLVQLMPEGSTKQYMVEIMRSYETSSDLQHEQQLALACSTADKPENMGVTRQAMSSSWMEPEAQHRRPELKTRRSDAIQQTPLVQGLSAPHGVSRQWQSSLQRQSSRQPS